MLASGPCNQVGDYVKFLENRFPPTGNGDTQSPAEGGTTVWTRAYRYTNTGYTRVHTIANGEPPPEGNNKKKRTRTKTLHAHLQRAEPKATLHLPVEWSWATRSTEVIHRGAVAQKQRRKKSRVLMRKLSNNSRLSRRDQSYVCVYDDRM